VHEFGSKAPGDGDDGSTGAAALHRATMGRNNLSIAGVVPATYLIIRGDQKLVLIDKSAMR
jgi:hypothetical protein